MKKSTSFLLCSLLIPQLLVTSYAGSPINIQSEVDAVRSYKGNDSVSKQIEELKKRNILLKSRPQFCPLNSTRNDALLSSVNAISAIFSDDCLDGMNGTMDQVLTGAEDVQTQINNVLAQQGKDPIDTTSSSMPTINGQTVDGAQIAGLIDGLNTIFDKNKCSSFDTTSFLDKSATILQSFSQFGLYSPSPSGITVAYGGLAVASILRFIDKLFASRFDFIKSDEDRQTFIKLNCAFYDVRRKVQEAGLLDISTDQNYKDLAEVNELLTKLEKKVESFLKDKSNLVTSVSKIKAKQRSEKEVELDKFVTPIAKLIETPVADAPGFPAEAKRNNILDELTQSYDQLVELLSDYITPKDGERMSRQNRAFVRYLSMIDEAGNIDKVVELEEMSISNFNKKFLRHLSFNLNRVLSDIEKKRTKFDKTFEDNKNFEFDGKKYSSKEVLAITTSKSIKSHESKDADAIKYLKELKLKLSTIISKKENSSEDNYNGADLGILEAKDKVSHFIYGEYGYEFLKDMTEKAEKENSEFIKRYKKFKNNFYRNNTYPKASTLNEDIIEKKCIDASVLREKWRYAQLWQEQGYDFVSTNKDLFGEPDSFFTSDRDKIYKHAQSKKLARRIITALNTVKSNQIKNKSDRVYVSFNGKKYTIEAAVEYLYDKFARVNNNNNSSSNSKFQNRRKKSYAKHLGVIMFEIYQTRSDSEKLQELTHDYRCDLKAVSEK